MIYLPQLDPSTPDIFPPPHEALVDPNGLLAFGGDLSPPRLLAAYAQGIFPWFSEGEPILWWSPDPRCVFRTETLRMNRSLRRQIAGKRWHVTIDHAFERVIRACAEPRHDGSGTWIVPAIIAAYTQLHRLGHAHSVEVWEHDELVGGVYGVAVGRMFCGESMFSRQSGGSKLALVTLAGVLRERGFPLLDAQVANAHTLGLGAVTLPRQDYLRQLAQLRKQPGIIGSWQALADDLPLPAAALR